MWLYIHVYVYIYIYTHIHYIIYTLYIEREIERERDMCIYIYIYVLCNIHNAYSNSMQTYAYAHRGLCSTAHSRRPASGPRPAGSRWGTRRAVRSNRSAAPARQPPRENGNREEHDSTFAVVQSVHLHQHTRAACACKSANMVSANMVPVALTTTPQKT